MVHVTAVVVKYKTPTGRVNKGVTTTWLADNKPDPGKPFPRVPVYIRKSQFRYDMLLLFFKSFLLSVVYLSV